MSVLSWTPEDDARMLDLLDEVTFKEAAHLMGRTISSLVSRHRRIQSDAKIYPYAVRRRAQAQYERRAVERREAHGAIMRKRA